MVRNSIVFALLAAWFVAAHGSGSQSAYYGHSGSSAYNGPHGSPSSYGHSGSPSSYGHSGSPASYGHSGSSAYYGSHGSSSYNAPHGSSVYYGPNGSRTADMEYLLKQKKIYDLLYYVDQNVLPDSEYYEIARSYDLAANLEYYTNKEAAMEFLAYFRSGMLSRDALFSYYNEEHRYEMVLLYRLFYFAKDFATFYKTACWARYYINPGMFVAAFTNAIAYRSDTRYIHLPPVYEIYPSMFFDAKTISDAYRLKMTHGYSNYHGYDVGFKHSEGSDSAATYYLYANRSYSYYYYPTEYSSEYQLNYFTQDVSLNSYYYYFRMAYPFWMNTKEYDMPSNFRGDFYYFWHKQLMARYNLERYSNKLNQIHYYSWDSMDMPGFYSDLSFSNGVAMPSRDWWNVVPFYKYKYVEYIKQLESRIMDIIDSGYIYDHAGKQISLYTPEGLNYFGNLIEGNYDSYNLQYYGSYEVLARKVFGMNYGYNKNAYVPSSLEYFSTCLRDPAFYRIYDRILYYFQKYKSNLHRYNMNEVGFPGVKIQNVEVDKMVTFWDKNDYYINNAVAVDSFKEGKSFNIKVWQQYLNYKPFTYKFAVNSDKDTRGVVRIFLGPAFEGENFASYYDYFKQYYKYFFMLDQFDVPLKSGVNNFERSSTMSPFFFNYNYQSSQSYYGKIMKAIEGNEPFTYKEYSYGFPSNLMLPKGSPEGMKYQMFFYIGPYEEGQIYETPFFGKFNFYGKSFGFPLDRPVAPWFFNLDNLYFKDVNIYHMSEYQYQYPKHNYNY